MATGNSRIYSRAILIAVLVGLTLPFVVRRTVSFYTDGEGVREEAVVTRTSLRDVLWQRPSRLTNLPEEDHYEPRLSPFGEDLLFTVGRPGTGADLWTARRQGHDWLRPEPVKALNSEQDDMGASFRGDGRAVVFSSNRDGGFGGYDLWTSVFHDGAWQEPRNLGPAVNTAWHETSPTQRTLRARRETTLDPENELQGRLYFASDRPVDLADSEAGGVASRESLRTAVYDLYACDLSWVLGAGGIAVDVIPVEETKSVPVDGMVAEVTSPVANVTELNLPESSEVGISFSPAGDFVYFASDREGGHGGFDLFRVRLAIDDTFGAVEGLGPQVNSAFDELDPGLAGHGFELFFASNRDGRDAVFSTVAREVYFAQEEGDTYWSITAVLGFIRDVVLSIQPAILALLISLLLCLLAWLVCHGRFGRLDLVLRCLVVALVTHLLLFVWMDTSRIQRFLLQSFPEPHYEFVEIAADGSFEENVSFAIRTAEAETVGDAAPSFTPSARVIAPQQVSLTDESSELTRGVGLGLLAGRPSLPSLADSLATPALEPSERGDSFANMPSDEFEAVPVDAFEEPVDPDAPDAPRRANLVPQVEQPEAAAQLASSPRAVENDDVAVQLDLRDAVAVRPVEVDASRWHGAAAYSPERPEIETVPVRGRTIAAVVPAVVAEQTSALASNFEGTRTERFEPAVETEVPVESSLELSARFVLEPEVEAPRESGALELAKTRVVTARFAMGSAGIARTRLDARVSDTAPPARPTVAVGEDHLPEPSAPQAPRAVRLQPRAQDAEVDARLASQPRRATVKHSARVQPDAVLQPERPEATVRAMLPRAAPRAAPSRGRRSDVVPQIARAPQRRGAPTSRYQPGLQAVPGPAPQRRQKPAAELAVTERTSRVAAPRQQPRTRPSALALQSSPATVSPLIAAARLAPPAPSPSLPTRRERPSTLRNDLARGVTRAPPAPLAPLRAPRPPAGPVTPSTVAIAGVSKARKGEAEPPILERQPAPTVTSRQVSTPTPTKTDLGSARTAESPRQRHERVLATDVRTKLPQAPERSRVRRVGRVGTSTAPKVAPLPKLLARAPMAPVLPGRLKPTAIAARQAPSASVSAARELALARRSIGSRLSLPTAAKGPSSVPLPAVPDARVVFLPRGPERLVRRSGTVRPEVLAPGLPLRTEERTRSLALLRVKTALRPKPEAKRMTLPSRSEVVLPFAVPRTIVPEEPELVGLPSPFSSRRVPLTLGALPTSVVALSRAVRPIALVAADPGVRPVRPGLVRADKRSRFVPRVYEMREKANRIQALRAGGGSALTEVAVERGLEWLARHQSPDGRWSLYHYTKHLKKVSPRDLKHPDWAGRRLVESRGGNGRARSGDTAATGLALLCFLGHGDSHMEPGQYQAAMSGGLDWLLSAQQADGDLRGDGNLYMHAVASFALCEAYAFTRDPKLREPAQRSIDFTVRCQNPKRGGWRYLPYPQSSDVDTSVFGWMLMAVKSAKLGGLSVDPSCLERAGRYLDSARMTPAGGRYAYQPKSSRTSLAMTAQGLFCHQLLSDVLRRGGTTDVELSLAKDESVRYVLNHLPNAVGRQGVNFYYWYYATLALFQEGGRPWEVWNESASQLVVLLQLGEEDGTAAGSWDPKNLRAAFGGRVYATAMSVLILEVYYRYAHLDQAK